MAKHQSATNFKCRIIRALTGFIGNITGNVTGDVTGAVTLPEYTQVELDDGTTLPVDENDGMLVRCSDGDDGSPCLALSNGTNWLRIVLGAAVDDAV